MVFLKQHQFRGKECSEDQLDLIFSVSLYTASEKYVVLSFAFKGPPGSRGMPAPGMPPCSPTDVRDQSLGPKPEVYDK